ncbi:MAG: hypothetical protein SFX18_13800 [Pirellulales bacterium]|nr:hypothetical protein [Pirellulales bacterium]
MRTSITTTTIASAIANFGRAIVVTVRDVRFVVAHVSSLRQSHSIKRNRQHACLRALCEQSGSWCAAIFGAAVMSCARLFGEAFLSADLRLARLPVPAPMPPASYLAGGHQAESADRSGRGHWKNAHGRVVLG